MSTLASLKVVLGLDSAEYTSGLGAVEKSTGKLGGIAKGAGKVIAGGMAIGGAALLAVGAKAFDMASDVNQATNDVAAQLGITKDEAKGFEGVMKGVFANNFGEDFEDIAGGLVALQQNLKDLTPASDAAQQALLEGGFALRDAYGVGLEETFNAVNTLMEDFGLQGQEAMDLVTAGFQRGLNSSDDFLDTITEYSTQFSNAGADAGQFFSLLESGMQGGMLGTDRAADAFKEFRLRVTEMGDDAVEAFGKISIPQEKLIEQIESGQISIADAFQMVVERLGDMDDPIEAQRIGVALMGTQFEDLGTQAALALDLTGTKIGDLAGATESLNTQYNSLGAVAEGAWRGFLVAIEPAGAALLGLANQAMPAVSDFMTGTLTPAISTTVDWLTTNLPVAIQTASDLWTGTLQPALQVASDFISGTVMPVIEGLADLFSTKHEEMSTAASTTWEAIQGTIETVTTTIQTTIETVFGAIQVFWEEHGEEIKTFADETWGKIQEIVETATQLIQTVVETVFGAIGGFIQTHGDEIVRLLEIAWSLIQTYIETTLGVIQGLINVALAIMQGDWSTAWDEIKGIVQTAWDGIKALIEAAGDAIALIIGGLVADIQRKFTEIDWGAVGSAVIDGIKGGISNAAGRLATSAANAAKRALDAAKRMLGIGSPSKVFMAVGEQMMAGMAQGLGANTGGIAATIRQLVDRITAMMDTMLAAIQQKVGAVQSWMDQLANSAVATGDTIASAMTSMASEALSVGLGPTLSETDRILMDLGLNPGSTSGFTGVRAPAPIMPAAATVGAGGVGAQTIQIHIENINGTDREAARQFGNHIRDELRRNGVTLTR